MFIPGDDDDWPAGEELSRNANELFARGARSSRGVMLDITCVRYRVVRAPTVTGTAGTELEVVWHLMVDEVHDGCWSLYRSPQSRPTPALSVHR